MARPHPISRRGFLWTSGALMASAMLPRHAFAGRGRDPRFVTMVLRGALDGLAAVEPIGDPGLEPARGGLVLPATGQDARLPLDGFFALNPRMPGLARLFAAGEAIIAHAAATPYRDRSHFDGQDVLESGRAGPGRLEDGWLNRAIGLLPAGEAVDPRHGLALGAEVPLIMRGAAPVVTLLPPGFRAAAADTRQRLLDLYRHTDPLLAARLADALKLDAALGGDSGRRAMEKTTVDPQATEQVRAFRAAGVTAGRLLARPDGPRVGAMSLLGWDTHAAEGPVNGRLGNLLTALDQAIDGLRAELGAAWGETVVAIVTEFGRTVRVNGSSGTDHGTGGVAFLVGGALAGGRVVADWPGLAEAALHEGRDVKPTTDLRALLKGVLRDHLGLSERGLAETVFPDTAGLKPVEGLVRGG